MAVQSVVVCGVILMCDQDSNISMINVDVYFNSAPGQ
jgi:hypothetical protein